MLSRPALSLPPAWRIPFFRVNVSWSTNGATGCGFLSCRFSLITVINLVLLYCPAALALTEDEAAAAVDAQGKDAVSGNLFLWLLCAIAFLKVATKLDGILHSLGIGVSRSPGSMLSEALLAFRGFEIGKAFMGLGTAKTAVALANAKDRKSVV